MLEDECHYQEEHETRAMTEGRVEGTVAFREAVEHSRTLERSGEEIFPGEGPWEDLARAVVHSYPATPRFPPRQEEFANWVRSLGKDKLSRVGQVCSPVLQDGSRDVHD